MIGCASLIILSFYHKSGSRIWCYVIYAYVGAWQKLEWFGARVVALPHTYEMNVRK